MYLVHGIKYVTLIISYHWYYFVSVIEVYTVETIVYFVYFNVPEVMKY